MSQKDIAEAAAILGCPVLYFPCTYLGSPLSLNKIPHGFLCLLSKRWIKDYLAAIHFSILGRAPAAIPSYYMSYFMWPSKSIASLVWQIYLLLLAREEGRRWREVLGCMGDCYHALAVWWSGNQALLCKFAHKVLQSSPMNACILSTFLHKVHKPVFQRSHDISYQHPYTNTPQDSNWQHVC